jgi:hypothetical protein
MDKRENLKKLADYLSALPLDYEHFNMISFMEGVHTSVEREYALHNGGVGACGAVACAVGHGPTAGILFTEEFISEGGGVMWPEYTYANFIVGRRFSPEAANAFSWMFGGRWAPYDNTPHGAAARIYYYLRNGVPESFDVCKSFRYYVPIYQEYIA